MTNKPQFVGERALFSETFAEVSRGVKKFKQKQYADHGLHPIIDQGKEVIAGYSDEESGLFADVPAIVFGDHTRCVKYLSEPFFAGADGVKILKPKLPGTTRFWWHALKATPIEDLGYSRHFKLLKAATFKLFDENQQAEVAANLDSILEQIACAKSNLHPSIPSSNPGLSRCSAIRATQKAERSEVGLTRFASCESGLLGALFIKKIMYRMGIHWLIHPTSSTAQLDRTGI